MHECRHCRPPTQRLPERQSVGRGQSHGGVGWGEGLLPVPPLQQARDRPGCVNCVKRPLQCLLLHAPADAPAAAANGPAAGRPAAVGGSLPAVASMNEAVAAAAARGRQGRRFHAVRRRRQVRGGDTPSSCPQLLGAGLCTTIFRVHAPDGYRAPLFERPHARDPHSTLTALFLRSRPAGPTTSRSTTAGTGPATSWTCTNTARPSPSPTSSTATTARSSLTARPAPVRPPQLRARRNHVRDGRCATERHAVGVTALLLSSLLPPLLRQILVDDGWGQARQGPEGHHPTVRPHPPRAESFHGIFFMESSSRNLPPLSGRRTRSLR